MEKNTELEVNISAIRKTDPHLKEVLDSATHVALYCFNAHRNEWEKTNIEGALFLYTRHEEPTYRMFIMNRLSPENRLEPIVKELDLQVQDSFLLYKNKQQLIFGIWFYYKDDCVRIYEVLQRLVKKLQVSTISDKKSMGKGTIMNMLSKAQEDYNSHKSPLKGDKPKEMASAPQSVMDFFAKAGISQLSTENHLPHPPGLQPPSVPIAQRLPVYAIPHSIPANEITHPVVQRIMSVDHIEKHQKTNISASRGQDAPALNNVENGMVYMRIGDSPSGTVIPSQQFFNSNASQPAIENSHVNGLDSIEGNKPALMPPTMFTSSGSKDPSDKMETKKADSNIHPKQFEPLTKNQIVQAVSYLLKNDADFVNKLHEAYIKSFKDIVST